MTALKTQSFFAVACLIENEVNYFTGFEFVFENHPIRAIGWNDNPIYAILYTNRVSAEYSIQDILKYDPRTKAYITQVKIPFEAKNLKIVG